MVLVYTKELLHQWVEQSREFLGPPPAAGLIGGSQYDVSERLTVALFFGIYEESSLEDCLGGSADKKGRKANCKAPGLVLSAMISG